MKVMGHRGAAGLALENTLDSFKMSKLLGVDFIELDVHKTKDDILVVSHDSNMNRISGKNLSIKNHKYSELKEIKLIDGVSYMPTLEEVLKNTGNIPLMIEIKDDNCLEKIISCINNYPKRDISIASFKHNELKKLRKLNIENKLFALDNTNPFEILQIARRHKLNGIGINYWLLNPLTYIMARRNKLIIYVYTVNNLFIGNLIKFLYPQTIICTDFPEKFLSNKTLPKK